MRTAYAVVQDSKDAILYNGAKVANGGVAITKKSALLGLAEYKSAVWLGRRRISLEINQELVFVRIMILFGVIELVVSLE